MTRKKRAQNARAAKDARMKKVAIGLSVVLVAVLAFEVPKLMHSGSSSSTPPAATTTPNGSTAATGAPVTTATGTPAVAATPTTSTKVPNSDVAPQASKGQLDSFTHFTGKDPFAQQVSDAAPTSTSSSSSQQPGNGTLSANVSSGSLASSAGNGQVQHPSRTLAATGAARISVNGRVQVVRVGASFPSANPLFRLVGLAHGGVRIGISNGSYSSGAQTVSLTPGRTVTLVDTADGIRYKIRLLSAS
jgi:hypothetical protein